MSYEFDASALDFDELFNVVIRVRHIGLDGTRSRNESRCLGTNAGCSTSETIAFYGCQANVEISREYNYRGGGASCRIDAEVVEGQTSIVIPPPTRTGDGCTAPDL